MNLGRYDLCCLNYVHLFFVFCYDGGSNIKCTKYFMQDNKDVMKLVLGKHNLSAPITSYARPEVAVKSQSFFFTHSVKAMAVTQTAKGITSKQLLIGTIGDQVCCLYFLLFQCTIEQYNVCYYFYFYLFISHYSVLPFFFFKKCVR